MVTQKELAVKKLMAGMGKYLFPFSKICVRMVLSQREETYYENKNSLVCADMPTIGHIVDMPGDLF